MSDYLTETRLWNMEGNEGILTVSTDFQVIVSGQVLDVNGISGLAMLTLANNSDSLIPKKELLTYAQSIELPYDPLEEGSSLNRQSNITRGVNAFRKALRNPFSKNVLLLGSSGSPDQCWYMATDLRDPKLVIDAVAEQVSKGDIPHPEAVLSSAEGLFRREELDKKHSPVKPRVAHSGSRVDHAAGIMPLRDATKEENDELFKFIAYGGEPGSEVTETEIKTWLRVRNIGRMETEKIINIARRLELIKPDVKSSDIPGKPAEVVYVRQ